MLASHEARLTKLEAGMEVLNADMAEVKDDLAQVKAGMEVLNAGMAEVKETLRLILQHLMGQSAFPAGIVNNDEIN